MTCGMESMGPLEREMRTVDDLFVYLGTKRGLVGGSRERQHGLVSA